MKLIPSDTGISIEGYVPGAGEINGYSHKELFDLHVPKGQKFKVESEFKSS